MKIGIQALLMVLSPLFLGLATIGAFYVLLDNTRQDLLRVHNAKEFVACSDQVLAALAKGAVTSILFNATGDEEFSRAHSDAEKAAVRAIKNLKVLAGEDRAKLQMLKIFGRSVAQSIVGQQMVMKAPGFESTGQLFRAQNGQSLAKMNPPAETPQEKMIKADKALADRAPTIQKQTRDHIRLVLIAAVAAELILAAVLAIYFNKRILTRIESVLENTRRLKKREALKAPIRGEDELALLDQVFYNSAKQIIENESFKQQLIGIASHDLKTPLASVKLTLSMLIEGSYGQLTPEATKRVKLATNSLERLIRLVNDLLDAERMTAGKFSLSVASWELAQLIGSATAAVEDLAAKRKIEIKCKFPERDIYCDYDRLVQVLVNLLSNAIKFSEASASIELDVALFESEDEVEIKVIDHGRGIPEDKLDKLFARFQQVEYKDASEKGGTGLGLAISKAIVEEHGGSIKVESKFGSGSTFILRFPGLDLQKVKANAK